MSTLAENVMLWSLQIHSDFLIQFSFKSLHEYLSIYLRCSHR